LLSDKIFYGYSPINFPEYNISDNYDYSNNPTTKTIPRDIWLDWWSFYKITKSCAVSLEIGNFKAKNYSDNNHGIHIAVNKEISPQFLKFTPLGDNKINFKIKVETIKLGEDTLNLALVVHGD
jgi:hypothetical protein